MEKTLIVANWKSNKTKNEAKQWLEEFSKSEIPDTVEVVILPPFTLLDFISEFIKENNLSIKIGAQDVSMFTSGAHTGEVNAAQIKEFASYVLIGHSERRSGLSESTDMIKLKTENALGIGLAPIVCLSSFDQARGFEMSSEIIFAYEPPGSISTDPNGKPEEVGAVSDFARKFTSTFQNKLIYGGSVDPDNADKYLGIKGIGGILVGGKSLSVESFSQIISNV